jgi:hypothetical protein
MVASWAETRSVRSIERGVFVWCVNFNTSRRSFQFKIHSATGCCSVILSYIRQLSRSNVFLYTGAMFAPLLNRMVMTSRPGHSRWTKRYLRIGVELFLQKCLFFVGYFMKLWLCRLCIVEWKDSWWIKGFGRKRPCPNRISNLVFALGDWEKTRQTLVRIRAPSE